MLRNLRSIRRNKESVTEIIGIILMVTVALVAATTLQVYLSQPGGDKPGMPPIIIFKQTGSYLTVTNVQYGPIDKDSISFKVFDTDGNYICDGNLTANGENIAGGDVVTISGSLVSGQKYSVLAIYAGGQVGREQYIAP